MWASLSLPLPAAETLHGADAANRLQVVLEGRPVGDAVLTAEDKILQYRSDLDGGLVA